MAGVNAGLSFWNQSEEMKIVVNNNSFEASRGAEAQSVTVNRLVVGSIPTRGMKYLLKFIFSFLRPVGAYLEGT